MANSKFEYIRLFETPDSILPDTWIVIRIDGRGFHKLSAKYAWQKPNDERAINLMNEAAKAVMREVQDLVVAYGQSDEYSFVFPPGTHLFDRRASKLTSTLLSTFTSYYTHLWPTFFPTLPLSPPLPTFDARHIVYPTTRHIRDYLSWRQADCHVNNLYNTTFWTLVQKEGMGGREAEERLKGSVSGEKNEILWGHGCNYNEVDAVWRKGSVVWRDYRVEEEKRGEGQQAVNDLGAEDVELRTRVDGDDGQNDAKGNADSKVAAPTETLSATPPTPGNPSVVAPTAEPTPTPTTLSSSSSSASSTTTSSNPPPKPHHPRSSLSPAKPPTKTQLAKQAKRRQKATITISHVDIIKDAFWEERPWVLGDFP